MSERTVRAGVAVLLALLFVADGRAQDDARKIVGEAQRRTESKSQRYEGLLQVLDANGKVADKRWTASRSALTSSDRNLMATLRPSRMSSASYTTPMPPAPRRDRIL